MKGFVTTTQAAALLGISTARVRQLILDGILAADKLGRQNVIAEKEIARLKGTVRKAGRPPKSRSDA
jgi:excisionase family DNA binding protein